MKVNEKKDSILQIGLVTPSAPAPALFPSRFERGVECLQRLGFGVKCGAYVSTKDGVTAASAEKRAKDIIQMFLDEDISLIMATIGGDYCAEILKYIDWNVIHEKKKGLMGYSDITILLHAIGIFAHQIVFYGPTLMTEMAEYPVPPQLSQTSFMDVFSDASTYEVTPCDALLEKGSDWALPPKERKALCPVKQRVIRSGKASGVVLGGCIEALERLRGTRYWPCFKDSLLILETVDDEFDEKKWRSLIVDYTNMGIFEEVAGIIIGQKTWNDDEVDKLSEMFLKVTTENAVPILYGLPFGHISPIATIPLFAKATLDSDLMKLIYNKPFEYGYVLR